MFDKEWSRMYVRGFFLFNSYLLYTVIFGNFYLFFIYERLV
ncbi:hypothetical protein DCCM_3755 [Desulfocucumis palustris]|uniref:Uncharacterized protein n=1 Tax=Desulfocucumis palustris TaxID=1898651 RepID=A0A2L2XEH6_9FIRM|nr:hypothetical protein DCCM_3755 [Desulfocucumis palustris]